MTRKELGCESWETAAETSKQAKELTEEEGLNTHVHIHTPLRYTSKSSKSRSTLGRGQKELQKKGQFSQHRKDWKWINAPLPTLEATSSPLHKAPLSPLSVLQRTD